MNIPTLPELAGNRAIALLLSRKGAFIASLLVLSILTFFLIQTYARAERDSGNDFTSYLASARALLDGGDPYHTGSAFPFVYPLFLCVLLIPLTALPYWLSILLWFLGSIVALFFSALVCLRGLSPSSERAKFIAVAAVSFLILVDVIQNNLLNGQVNLFVLLFCSLFLREYLRLHKIAAAAFLAAAIAVKLTPLILLVYLILRKEFSTVALVTIMALVFMFGLPYFIGGGAIFGFTSSYANSFLRDNLVPGGTGARDVAFSLTSIISALVPSLPRPLALLIAGIAVLAPVIRFQLHSKAIESNKRELPIFSLYLLAMLLISPVGETHHLIFLAPSLLFVVMEMVQPPQRYFNSGLLIVAAVLASLVVGRAAIVANVVAILSLYFSMMQRHRSSAGGASP